jgi:hypothetical protein
MARREILFPDLPDEGGVRYYRSCTCSLRIIERDLSGDTHRA